MLADEKIGGVSLRHGLAHRGDRWLRLADLQTRGRLHELERAGETGVVGGETVEVRSAEHFLIRLPRPVEGEAYVHQALGGVASHLHAELRRAHRDLAIERTRSCLTSIVRRFSIPAPGLGCAIADVSPLSRRIPMPGELWSRARSTQLELATNGDHRRVPPADLLLASTAEEADVILIHYDRDYERIAGASGLRHEWLAPDGTLT
jgi:hypothetical protein